MLKSSYKLIFYFERLNSCLVSHAFCRRACRIFCSGGPAFSFRHNAPHRTLARAIRSENREDRQRVPLLYCDPASTPTDLTRRESLGPPYTTAHPGQLLSDRYPKVSPSHTGSGALSITPSFAQWRSLEQSHHKPRVTILEEKRWQGHHHQDLLCFHNGKRNNKSHNKLSRQF